MGGEDGTSNGDTEWLKKETVTNGFGVGIEHDFGDGSSAASGGFRTYKRRKHTRSSSEGKGLEDGRPSLEAASQLAEKKHGRNVVLAQWYQSLNDDEGGIQRCIREALVFHPELNCATIKGCDTRDRDRDKYLPTGIPNGSQYSTKGHVGVFSGGPLNKSNHCIITDMCQRAFFDIIISEKFSLLCKLIFENFQGIKVDGFFDLSMINSRMKGGIYESSPMIFDADIQQVWRKLQEIGAEMISLAKSLAELSRNSCNEHIGGLVRRTFNEEKNELFTQEPDADAKLEQTEAYGVNEVSACKQCEENADGKDCLVCDSCEEIYHVSCIEPAVKEIPPKSWYCARCTANGIGSPHENCVVCERLNAPRNHTNQVGEEISPTNEETFLEFEGNSNSSTDKDQVSEGSKQLLYPCMICRIKVTSCDEFKLCGHPFCPNKSFHVRCLTPKQLKLYGHRWLCPSCLCRGCLTDKDDDDIVLCDSCDQAFHIYCMEPPRTVIPKGRWYCRKCDAGIREIRRVKKAYENKQKKKCDEGIKASENKQRRKGNESIKPYESFEKELNEKGEEESEGDRGGMDMLLNAANTLKFQENLAAIKTKS